ncbi:MAG: leucyl aminopeptidase family protein [Fimbriimonadaceae bacterium]|nr:leucyl aminopeptidase family protein [Alphaproteobacteria bacterium]
MSDGNSLKNILLPSSYRGRRIPVHAVEAPHFKEFSKQFSGTQNAWFAESGFKAGSGELLALPDAEGRISEYLFGLGKDEPDRFIYGMLPGKLPKGNYDLGRKVRDPDLAVLAWLLGSYRFERYTKSEGRAAKLVCPKGVDAKKVLRLAHAVWLTRDLINTPANDMGPEQLAAAAKDLAKRHKASVRTIVGDQLLKENFPMIHAVGRASDRAPRLIDLKWGHAKHPKVTLVGKGVCFDTGGLDLKPSSAMGLMKKDMGGAANVLGLADMIMAARLKVRLRVLVPAVENSVSANAFRPGDVLQSRKGLTVEIGNTDAEGRLVLADALAFGDQEKPDLLIDMATLTGAARVALGPDVSPFYTHNDDVAGDLMRHSEAVDDPLWRMPLWKGYDEMLASKVADLNHISTGPFAGSITAALFLARFVEKAKNYIHFDIYGWTPKARHGRPEGGEAQGIRALYAYLEERFGG